MRLRPPYTPPDEPTPMPGDRNDEFADGFGPHPSGRPVCPHCGQSEEPYPCCLLAEEGYGDLYRRFVFSAQVLGWSLVILFAIGLTMLAWVRVFAGH